MEFIKWTIFPTYGGRFFRFFYFWVDLFPWPFLPSGPFFRECFFPWTTHLSVTLDRTLSFREHLTKTAGQLKYRNFLLNMTVKIL